MTEWYQVTIGGPVFVREKISDVVRLPLQTCLRLRDSEEKHFIDLVARRD